MNLRRLSRLTFLVVLWLGTRALARADVYGGIEIGAKGLRALAVDVSPTPAGVDSKILMVENQNTTLVADLAAKKQFSAKALEETVDHVDRMAKKIREEFKVGDNRIFVVGSSGLFAPLEGNVELIKSNKELLVEAIRKKTGVTMDFVSITREAELTILSVVPAKFGAEAILLDIGSGNTKGGGEKPGGGLMTIGIPFGTVSFADRVAKEAEKGRFVETAASLRDKVLVPQLRDALLKKKELAERQRVYLAGGSVWALTTFMKPLDRSHFVPLSVKDIETFHKFLVDHPGELPNPDLSGAADAQTKKLALKDLDQVRKTFSRDQLIAGVEILRALSTAFRFDAADKQIVFARNAYIGSILGYTIEKGTPAK